MPEPNWGAETLKALGKIEVQLKEIAADVAEIKRRGQPAEKKARSPMSISEAALGADQTLQRKPE